MKLILESFKNYEKQILNEQFQITDQTSFKVFDGEPQLAAKVMNELLKGGDLFNQLQKAQLGKWYTTKSVEELKSWVDGIGGVNAFAKRAAGIGAKIPEQGLAKKDMPFLPGPPDATGDVKDVEDALSPGGKYNVDIVEKTNAPPPNTFVGMGDEKAVDYMTKGLKDGDPNDDVINIQLGGGFPAAEGIPTQTNILLPKSLGMAVRGIKGGNLDAYASLDNEILDGHHRWAATMLNDPTAQVGTVARIDMKKAGMKDTLKHLTAIGNALGNKTKTK